MLAKMSANLWLVLIGGICCGPLAASPMDTLDNDGTWNVRFAGDARTARQARVEFHDGAGTWQDRGPRRAGDACYSTKPLPVTVQKSNSKEVEFSVWAASVKPACPDFALELRVADERTLTGTTSDGHEVRLTREPAKRSTKR